MAVAARARAAAAGAPFSSDVMDDPARGPRFGPIERDIASREDARTGCALVSAAGQGGRTTKPCVTDRVV